MLNLDRVKIGEHFDVEKIEKIEILVKNRNFGQKSKFWSKR